MKKISIRINNKGEHFHIKTLDSFPFNPLFNSNLNTKDPQRTKQNHYYNNQLSLMILILCYEDEPNQPQNIKDQNTTTLKEQTLALQYPTKSDYCNQQIPFFDPSFFEYKNIFIISSSQKIPQ